MKRGEVTDDDDVDEMGALLVVVVLVGGMLGEIDGLVGNFLIVMEVFSLLMVCFGMVTRSGAGVDEEEFPVKSFSEFSFREKEKDEFVERNGENEEKTFSKKSFLAFSAANCASISIKRFGR